MLIKSSIALWYRHVRAPPPARWFRYAAQLFPHALLLTWASALSGTRDVAAFDMRSCAGVVVLPLGTEEHGALAVLHVHGVSRRDRHTY